MAIAEAYTWLNNYKDEDERNDAIFYFENGISNSTFIGLVGHKENKGVYGELYKTNKGMMLKQFKWREVNKGASVPKVSCQLKHSYKMLNGDVWKSFDKLTNEEYDYRENCDYLSLK